ncbi:G-type lectin S-receptor-like serine/threonine-protein kinase RKS1 [Rhodamnia argentea]|uniref:Receptor-like serine/threonine-protein kinase n=1 Tax=Rhodamnia argentea TaxID=178133 RepID=A0ABM3HW03_9MYRT|nr:G-type lectin S-receptor-like serine/threonine-protein kinase RKS1 [Rhodamnia argentea]
MKDGDVLISRGGRFARGFFSPGNSGLRYLGIWYHGQPERTIVWVANRGNPVNDTSGVLAFDHDGNLVIHENNGSFPIWSTNVSSTTLHNSTTAQLLDSGNLVLNHGMSEVVIWQSFHYPADTFLPSMKLRLDRRTGLNSFLTSWISEDDPASGRCSYKFEPTGYPQLFLYKDRAPYWRPGPIIIKWQGSLVRMANDFIYNIIIVNSATEVSLMCAVINASVLSRYVVHESGLIKHFMWHDEEQRWTEFNYHPKELCDYYNKCGPNGICGANDADQFNCTCLPGFEPKSPGDWYLGDGTGGCKRRQGASICQSGGGFVKVKQLKLPDTSTAHVDMSLTLKECLRDCNCTAYSSANGGLMGPRAYYKAQLQAQKQIGLQPNSQAHRTGPGPKTGHGRTGQARSWLFVAVAGVEAAASGKRFEGDVRAPAASGLRGAGGKGLRECWGVYGGRRWLEKVAEQRQQQLQVVQGRAAKTTGQAVAEGGCSWLFRHATAEIRPGGGWAALEEVCGVHIGNCNCSIDFPKISVFNVIGTLPVPSFTARYRKRSILVKKAMVPTISISALVLLLLGSLMYCLLLKRKRDRRGRNHPSSTTTSSTYLVELQGLKYLDRNARQKTDLPFLDFGTVAAATSNFSSLNELGKGGFGSVYKGTINYGTEIAVKRLSKCSGQGNEEFKNEVRLIAKLQRRNLVKILGCCIHEDKKLLIYEYLPNKSLDSFIFDETKRSLLEWGRSFGIAYGVARRLLHLHQDSMLRIIHRDLKASNVLLDVALNPKISDFGIARICGGDQIDGKAKWVNKPHEQALDKRCFNNSASTSAHQALTRNRCFTAS